MLCKLYLQWFRDELKNLTKSIILFGIIESHPQLILGSSIISCVINKLVLYFSSRIKTSFAAFIVFTFIYMYI